MNPCPFCNASAPIVKGISSFDGKSVSEEMHKGELEQYCVVCDAIEGGCGASSGYCMNETDAIALWNMGWQRVEEAESLQLVTLSLLKEAQVKLEAHTHTPYLLTRRIDSHMQECSK